MASLKQFSGSEIILSHTEASRVLQFFWPDTVILPSSLTDADRAFAQGLLVEAIDGSYNMGFVHHLFNSFFMKVPTSFGDIRNMVKDFVKAAAKHWFKHATTTNLQNPEIYESVRATLARNFKSVWKMRLQVGEF